jgi:hypothetical protein
MIDDKDNVEATPEKPGVPQFPIDRIELNEIPEIPRFPEDRIERGENPNNITRKDED